MVRTDPAAVRDELSDVFDEEDDPAVMLPDSKAETYISRAHHLVNNRVAEYIDDEGLLTDIERLVAAHFAVGEFASSVIDGRAVSQVAQGGRQLSFSSEDARSAGPGDYSSKYWGMAVSIDPTGRLQYQTKGTSVVST